MDPSSIKSNNYDRLSIVLVLLLNVCGGASTARCELKTLSLGDQLIGDAADGKLDDFSLGQAALIAGRDLSPAEFARSTRKLQAVVDDAVNAAKAAKAKDRPAALFRFLHKQVLVGEYRSGQNDLNRLLDKGDYNCVTATILYQTICRKSGIATRAIAAPAHVFCRLTDGVRRDVETTCPTWFQQPRRTAPRAGRSIDDLQLVGKIYYNRGVYFLEHERYPDALHQLELSLRFDDRDNTAKTNRLATYNNWALQCVEKDRFEEAAELLKTGMAIDATYGPFLANDLHIHQRWVRHLCEREREADAMQVLFHRSLARPDQPLFRDGPLSVYRHWLSRLARRGDWRDELDVLLAARRLIPDTNQLAEREREALGAEAAREFAEYAVTE